VKRIQARARLATVAHASYIGVTKRSRAHAP
jgi:hypothetical protein